MFLCKYKDIFGKPNEGVHSIRIFGIAAVDLGMTIVVAAAVAYFLGSWIINFFKVLILLLLLSIILHRLFCVRTVVDTLLFPD